MVPSKGLESKQRAELNFSSEYVLRVMTCFVVDQESRFTSLLNCQGI